MVYFGPISSIFDITTFVTRKISFLQSIASWLFPAMTLIIMAVEIFVPMGTLAGILLGYVGLTTVMKRWYIRKCGWQ